MTPMAHRPRTLSWRAMRLPLLLGLASSSVAHGAAPETRSASLDIAEEADVQFDLGVAAYKRGDYVGAVEHYLASNRLVPNRNVVYNLARAYEQLGRFDAAWRQYNEYVVLEPDPGLRAEGTAARDRLAARVALVDIQSDPPGALIFVDREELGARGQTPATIALPAGAHTVFLRRDGYHPTPTHPVSAVTGARTPASFALSPVLGSLHLRASDPASDGAAVVLIGSRRNAEDAWVTATPWNADLGSLPLNVDLAPGQYELAISAVGHRPVVLPVELRAEQTLELPVDLPWLTGSIVVEAPERGAKIDLDGVPAGFTPAVLAGVRVGPHHLVVTSPGFRPYEVDVAVATDTAAPVTAELVSLNEVTAANRSAQSAEDAPASVTLVSADELRVFGDTTVWQALSNARGFYGTSDGTYEFVGVRGFARSGDYNNRILLTRDGHTLNDDQLGASYVGHDGTIDLSDVERIEVVRGAGSVLYGSNAFLGVVNVVSRSGESALPTHVVLGAESERTARVGAGTRVKLGESWLSVNAGGLLSQGLDYQFPDLATEENPLGTSQESGTARAAGATARLTGKEWSVVAWGNLRRKGIPTGAYDTILADPRAYSEDARGFAELRWEPRLNKTTALATRLYVDRYTFEGRYPYAGDVSSDGEAEPDDVVADSWRGTWGGAEARVLLNPTSWLGLTGGAEARLHLQAGLEGSDNAGTYLSSNTPFQVYSGYLLADLNPARAFSLSGGARLDAYSTFGVTVNPRLALIVRPGKHDTVKVLGGRAFRAPSPYELGYNDDGVTQIAAPDLGPEQIWSGEVEYTRRLGEVSTLTFSGFGHRIDNLIILTTTTPDPAPGSEDLPQATKLQYANDTSPVNAMGVEGELRREWRGGWLAGATATVQRSRTGSLIDGDPLENSPTVIVGVRGAMPLVAGITLASRVRSESSRLGQGDAKTPAAFIWDVHATGSLALGNARRGGSHGGVSMASPQAGSGRLSWSLGVRNLLDWKVYYPTGDDITHTGGLLPGAGRAVTAELGASW